MFFYDFYTGTFYLWISFVYILKYSVGGVAQMAERSTPDRMVMGSIPVPLTFAQAAQFDYNT